MAEYIAVHGIAYHDRHWHPTKQPKSLRDTMISSGELITLWQANGPRHWFPVWDSNPTVIRVRILNALVGQYDWMVSDYTVNDATAQDPYSIVTIAKRLWRLDHVPMLADEVTRLKRPLNMESDILDLDPLKLTRKVEGGVLFNKNAEDVPREDPTRAGLAGGRL